MQDIPRWSCPLHGSQPTWSCLVAALWQPPKMALQKYGMPTHGAASSLCLAIPDLSPVSSGVGMALSTPALGMAASWSGMLRYVSSPGSQCLVNLSWRILVWFDCELQLREHSPWVCSHRVSAEELLNNNSVIITILTLFCVVTHVQGKSCSSSIHAGRQIVVSFLCLRLYTREHQCFVKRLRTFWYLSLTFSVHWSNGRGWPQRPLNSFIRL